MGQTAPQCSPAGVIVKLRISLATAMQDLPPPRIATSADIAHIVELTNRAYVVEEALITGQRTDAADIAAKMKSGAFLLQGTTGSVYASVVEGRGYLGLLAIDPDHQGAGHAKRLVDAVEAWCRERQCRFLDLTVINLRRELFAFYRKLGFAPADVLAFPRPERMKVALHLVKMTKALVPVEQL
jgi:ribosomal protein S18 acetylase RimI-like enzyme